MGLVLGLGLVLVLGLGLGLGLVLVLVLAADVGDCPGDHVPQASSSGANPSPVTL